ncbi:MAG: efflux RND transporter periplasmic adaptor subunit [Fimbriimonadaceae bacterium]|nr:efflux RND transporter periplasmic adaptor subunit [Fimbriimonadaceae bacterium]QYK56805.1 MAG: efflux RND transporter periplasmic adaptor subunit [Fimbriimonadaceae bacterium]
MLKKGWPLALIAFLIAGCGEGSGPIAKGDAKRAEPKTVAVAKQDIVGYEFFDGELMTPPDAQAVITSPYDTRVEEVVSAVGNPVNRGETLIKLQIPGVDSAKANAKAGAASAEAAYEAERAQVSQPLRDARKHLEEARANEKAGRDAAAAGETVDLEALTVERKAAESEVARLQAEVNATLQPSKSAVRAAQTDLELAKEAEEKGILRSPIGGYIVAMDAKPGLDAKAKQVLATVVNPSQLRVKGKVPPEMKDMVKEGTDVVVTMVGAEKPLLGRVLSVSVLPPVGDSGTSPGYEAVIRFRDIKGAISPSKVTGIGVKTGTADDVLVVPVGAIHNKDGEKYVEVKRGNDWVSTPVETGLSDGALIEVKMGLKEGDMVRFFPETE